MKAITLPTIAAYLATIVGANYLIEHFGPVPVGFGLFAPAGVYLVGPALVLRDLVQWAAGRLWSVVAVLVGAALSFFVADAAVATASGAAFLLSELLDFVLFTWIAPRWARAVAVGGITGAVADSVVFLAIAFGSMAFLPGQVVGKVYGIVLAAVVVAARRRQIRSATA